MKLVCKKLNINTDEQNASSILPIYIIFVRMKYLFLIMPILLMLLLLFKIINRSDNKYNLNQNKAVYKVNKEIDDSTKRSYDYLANLNNERLKPIEINPSKKITYLDEYNKMNRVKPGIKRIILHFYAFYPNENSGREDTLMIVPANCTISNYNKDGLLIEKLYAYKADTAVILKYFYDSRNNMIKVRETNLYYKKYWEYYFIYDEKWGLLRKASSYLGNGINLYNYDSLGRISQSISVGNDDAWYENIYTYYENTAHVKLILSKNKNNNTLFEHRFNKKDQLIYESWNFTPDNKCDSTLYKYNKNGDIIQTESSSRIEPLIEKNEYIYDKKGNWIKKLQNTNGIKTRVIIRFIEYY